MPVEKVDTLVVGGGQAGLAMSEHLSACGVPHLVLERHRIAERWRSERWDSLVANGPAWHDRFPAWSFPGRDPEAFAPKEKVADYFVAYAKKIAAPDPLRRRGADGAEEPRSARVPCRNLAWRIEADNVVVATGPFQRPVIPPSFPTSKASPNPFRRLSQSRTNCPPGAVLVVGAGSSGVQIADDFSAREGASTCRSARTTVRRAYRGRDFCWWLGILGNWDAETPGPGTEHVTISVSGAYGGQTIDFRRLAAQGMTLVGRTDRSRTA